MIKASTHQLTLTIIFGLITLAFSSAAKCDCPQIYPNQTTYGNRLIIERENNSYRERQIVERRIQNRQQNLINEVEDWDFAIYQREVPLTRSWCEAPDGTVYECSIYRYRSKWNLLHSNIKFTIPWIYAIHLSFSWLKISIRIVYVWRRQ